MSKPLANSLVKLIQKMLIKDFPTLDSQQLSKYELKKEKIKYALCFSMNSINATVLDSFGDRLSKIELEVDKLLEKTILPPKSEIILQIQVFSKGLINFTSCHSWNSLPSYRFLLGQLIIPPSINTNQNLSIFCYQFLFRQQAYYQQLQAINCGQMGACLPSEPKKPQLQPQPVLEEPTELAKQPSIIKSGPVSPEELKCPLKHLSLQYRSSSSGASIRCNSCTNTSTNGIACTACNYTRCFKCCAPNHESVCKEQQWVTKQKKFQKSKGSKVKQSYCNFCTRPSTAFIFCNGCCAYSCNKCVDIFSKISCQHQYKFLLLKVWEADLRRYSECYCCMCEGLIEHGMKCQACMLVFCEKCAKAAIQNCS